MDLSYVISELRSELESLTQVITALEKLAEIRRRRNSGGISMPLLNGSAKPARLVSRARAGSNDQNDD